MLVYAKGIVGVIVDIDNVKLGPGYRVRGDVKHCGRVKIAQQKRFLLLRIRSRFVSDLGWRGRLRRAGSLRPNPRNAEKKRQ